MFGASRIPEHGVDGFPKRRPQKGISLPPNGQLGLDSEKGIRLAHSKNKKQATTIPQGWYGVLGFGFSGGSAPVPLSLSGRLTAHFPAPPNHCFLHGTWFVMLRAHLHVAFGGTVVINYCSGCPCGCSKGSLRGMEANLSHETMQTWEHPGMSHWRVILVDRTTSWTIFRPMFVVLLFLAHVFVYKTILALFFVHRSHDMYTTERDFLRPTSGAPPSRGATEC